MNTLTIDVRPLADSLADMVQAVEAQRPQAPRYSFANAASLMRTLGGKRFDLIQVLSGAGPVTIREAARRAGRDVKAVYGDVQTLLNCGVLSKTVDGKIELPYESVRVEFLLKAA
jgi:predicted transcriptional regulator